MSGLSNSLPKLTQKLLSAARLAGADAADALANVGSAIEINVRSGVLEQAERSEKMDLGLRVYQVCTHVGGIWQRLLRVLSVQIPIVGGFVF